MSLLNAKEIAVLQAAKEANPWWFAALLEAASIMTERRQKYSGTMHPLYNFAEMAYREGRGLMSIFRTFLNIKVARLAATADQDFSDERVADTLLDIANYALIGAGAQAGGLTPHDILPRDEWQARLQDDERVASGH